MSKLGSETLEKPQEQPKPKEPPPPITDPIQQQKVVTRIKLETSTIPSKVLMGLTLAIRSNKGVIDLNDPTLQEVREMYLGKDKDKPSIIRTVELDSEAQIVRLEQGGFEGVQELRDKVTAVRRDVTTTLSSKENIERDIGDYYKMKTLQVAPFQVIVAEKQGVYEAGASRSMGPDEGTEFNNMLLPALSEINIPEESVFDLIMNGGSVEKYLQPVAQKRVIEFFGKKEKDVTGQKVVILDREKLTPENIKAFGIAVNEDLANELAKMKAERLINEAIAQMESKYKVTFKPEIAEKIKKNLEPSVTALGSEYMEANRGELTEALSSSLRNQQGYLSRVRGNYPTSDLEKVARQFSAKYQPLADLHQQESIEGSLLGLQMANSKIAEKLTELGVEKAKALKYDAAKIPDEDLVRMRRENPEQFDRIVLKRDENAPDLTAVIDGIIVQAVYKLQKENGVKLTPEKVEDLKKQIKDNLTPALSKLDSEFLYSQREDISSNIQKQLYKNRPLGYAFGVGFSISDKSLVNISSGIIADYQNPSTDFERELVMGALHGNDTELAKRLNELAVEKASAVKYDANEITSKDLREIRQQNPTLFDQVVLGKKPAAKQVVAAPVQEQVQVVALPLQAPPLLSEHQNSRADLAKEQQKVRSKVPPAPPPRPSSPPPPIPGGQSGKGSPAAGSTEQQEGKRPLPLPREGGVDSSRSGQELMAAAFREHQEAKGSPPLSRDSIQNGRTVLSKDPRGERRSPTPPPRKASQNGREVPDVSTGEPLHPPTTPRPRLAPEGRKGGPDGHGR